MSQHVFNEKQEAEFSKISKYSDNLISENFNKAESVLKNMRKTINGYTIYRASSDINWIVKINIRDNQVEVKRSTVLNI